MIRVLTSPPAVKVRKILLVFGPYAISNCNFSFSAQYRVIGAGCSRHSSCSSLVGCKIWLWQFPSLVTGSWVGCVYVWMQPCVQLTCLLAVCTTHPKVSWGESSFSRGESRAFATRGGVLLNFGVIQHQCRSWTADCLLRVLAKIMIF